MRLGTTGIVINGFDQILLIQRNDSKTWAPPAGAMEIGELPTETVKREVQEETEVRVMPVRLVALQFRRFFGGRTFLQFVYRCMEAGGEPKPTEEALQVGYFRTQHLPEPMLGISRQQVEFATGHTGKAIWFESGVPWDLLPRWLWVKFVVHPRLDRERKAKGEPPYVPPPTFKVSVALGVRDAAGNLMWQKNTDSAAFPRSVVTNDQAPWVSAAQLGKKTFGTSVEITKLVGVFINQEEAEALLLWEGATAGNDGVAEVPADADEPSQRFANMILADLDLVQSEWL
ncbi:MAG: NUDIX domain-containing protein [Chloroflexota bacterium]